MTRHLADILFLPVVLLVGYFTSREDIARSRIPNKMVTLGILYAFIFYLLLTAAYFWDGPHKSWPFYVSLDRVFGRYAFIWSANLLVSIIIAYALWHNDAWGAGDAKLFICYAALVPMTQYQKIYFHGYFASFYLLYLSLVLAIVFIVVTALAEQIRTRDITPIRRLIHRIKRDRPGEVMVFITQFSFLNAALGFFTIFILMQILREWAQAIFSRWIPSQDIVSAAILIFSGQISSVVRKKAWTVLAVLAGLLVLFYVIYLDSPGNFAAVIKHTLGRSVVLALVFPAAGILAAYSVRFSKNKVMPFAPWLLLGTLAAWFIPR